MAAMLTAAIERLRRPPRGRGTRTQPPRRRSRRAADRRGSAHARPRPGDEREEPATRSRSPIEKREMIAAPNSPPVAAPSSDDAIRTCSRGLRRGRTRRVREICRESRRPRHLDLSLRDDESTTYRPRMRGRHTGGDRRGREAGETSSTRLAWEKRTSGTSGEGGVGSARCEGVGRRAEDRVVGALWRCSRPRAVRPASVMGRASRRHRPTTRRLRSCRPPRRARPDRRAPSTPAPRPSRCPGASRRTCRSRRSRSLPCGRPHPPRWTSRGRAPPARCFDSRGHPS